MNPWRLNVPSWAPVAIAILSAFAASIDALALGEDVEGFRSFISDPPNILRLRFEETSPSSPTVSRQWFAWSHDTFRLERTLAPVLIDGHARKTSIIAGGNYNSKYWTYGENVLTIFDEPSASFQDVLNRNDGISSEARKLFGVLQFGILTVAPGDIVFDGLSFSSSRDPSFKGKIKTISAGKVKELEYEYNGLKALASYDYNNLLPQYPFLPSRFKCVLTTPAGENFVTLEVTIEELETLQGRLPEELVNPELAYTSATLIRISGEDTYIQNSDGSLMPTRIETTPGFLGKHRTRLFIVLFLTTTALFILLARLIRQRR